MFFIHVFSYPVMPNESLKEYVISMRRYFHENPELSFQEASTISTIRKELEGMGLEVHEVKEGGLYADIQGMDGGKSVALRADMDGLPITEDTNLPFRSKNHGVMHACGHDAHVAMLLGVAKRALEMKSKFRGRIRLLFQVAEERPPGGAVSLIRAGALKGMDYVLGQHVISSFEAGTVATFPREAMANADEFRIRIIGKGGHGSAPHETIDALVVAAQFVTAAQAIVSRMIDPFLPSVVTFGTFNSGFRYNVIAPSADLTGTVRTFHREVQEKIRSELENVLKNICAAYGAEYQYEYSEGYPTVINTQEISEIVDSVAEEHLGKGKVLHPNPSMGGEDFAYYLHEIPGTFYFLGVGNAAKGITSPQHSPTYTVDEDTLEKGVEIMLGSALRLLS